MPTAQAWSWHLRLSGYKLELAKFTQQERGRRKGEPQIQKERKSKRRRNSGSEVRKEGEGGELFIAVNGYAVHKDRSEGYPKEKGQQRQVYLI